MKKVLLAICAFVLWETTARGQESHVILISIDGLRPEFYKDPSWNMVHLRQAMQEGVYADRKSVV
jgi:predicted AlkP superfamily pyrophosphatase or phosphodiesterase